MSHRTPTIPWDYARSLWRGKVMTIQQEGRPTRGSQDGMIAWRGVIEDSYYVLTPEAETPGAGSMLLRIRCVPDSIMCTDEFPTGNLPQGAWTAYGRMPRIVISTRTVDLAVLENERGRKGGDVWCMFEVPEMYQRPGGPYCRRGWLVVHMEEKRSRILRMARKLGRQRVKIF